MFEFTADAQLYPVKLNDQIGGEKDKLYLIIADSGTISGSGLDFISA